MLIHLFQGEAFFACASDDGDALKALIPLAFDFPSPAQHWCLFPLHEAKTKGKHFITFFCVPLMFCDVFYHEWGLRRGKELFRESTECEADAMFLILPFLNGITFLFRSKLVYRNFLFSFLVRLKLNNSETFLPDSFLIFFGMFVNICITSGSLKNTFSKLDGSSASHVAKGKRDLRGRFPPFR